MLNIMNVHNQLVTVGMDDVVMWDGESYQLITEEEEIMIPLSREEVGFYLNTGRLVESVKEKSGLNLTFYTMVK